MRSKPVASLLADLDVVKSHSRPHVSDDNPYSEAQFKTLKYRPEFPQRFGCIEDARTHCQAFFLWYNTQHCHSGIAYMTPHSVHYGLDTNMRVVRQATQVAANAHSCLDQPTTQGECPNHRTRRPHTKLVSLGVAKSLTRSDPNARGT
jgi:Integrase core domain